MSCPPEAACLLYAEGELDAAARRELESHLVVCRDCRERVLVLREEGQLLGAVLREDAAPSGAPRAAAAPEPGVALGVPLAIAAVTAALAAASFLIQARLPGAWELLDPRRLKGVPEMAFDLVFLLRESAPGLLEGALALGSVAGLSALLSLLVSSLGRRWLDRTALRGSLRGLARAGAGAPAAGAFELRRDETLRIEAGERISRTLLATGERVDVDGTIDGDLFAAAERVTVRGEVSGSLYVFTRDLEVTGTVGGAVHAFAERVRLEGAVDGPVYGFVEDFRLAEAGRVERDVNLIADAATLGGAIGRDLHVLGNRLDLRGRVSRDVRARGLEELLLRDGTDVAGDVEARLEAGREAERSPGARIGGELRVEPQRPRHASYLEHYRHWRFYAWSLLWFAAAFVFGLVVHQVAPGLLASSLVTGGELARTLAMGFVALVVTPLAVVAAALTVVGIPVAVALLFLFVVALYTADLSVAAWIGRMTAPPGDDSLPAFARSLGLGLAILTVASLVPFLGPAVGAVALLLGMGMLGARARDYLVR